MQTLSHGNARRVQGKEIQGHPAKDRQRQMNETYWAGSRARDCLATQVFLHCGSLHRSSSPSKNFSLHAYCLCFAHCTTPANSPALSCEMGKTNYLLGSLRPNPFCAPGRDIGTKPRPHLSGDTITASHEKDTDEACRYPQTAALGQYSVDSAQCQDNDTPLDNFGERVPGVYPAA